ncbi:unnamed protein product [Clavelina lepadiformis]|uniref:Homeobox domain-containing protein n=1 Tax=Clavelina lepadiformis TaxID=159417 RepID=A0ABP0FNM4_CLALP
MSSISGSVPNQLPSSSNHEFNWNTFHCNRPSTSGNCFQGTSCNVQVLIKSPVSYSRGRTAYSESQIFQLEKCFCQNPYPTAQTRLQLAKDINVPEAKVKIWFQNRRARAKKLQLSSNKSSCGLKKDLELSYNYAGRMPSTNQTSDYYNNSYVTTEEQSLSRDDNISLMTQQTSCAASRTNAKYEACKTGTYHTSELVEISNNLREIAKTETQPASNLNCTYYPAYRFPLLNKFCPSSYSYPQDAQSNNVGSNCTQKELTNLGYPYRFPVIQSNISRLTSSHNIAAYSHGKPYAVSSLAKAASLDVAGSSYVTDPFDAGSETKESYDKSLCNVSSEYLSGKQNEHFALQKEPQKIFPANFEKKIGHFPPQQNASNHQLTHFGVHNQHEDCYSSQPPPLQSPPIIRRFVIPFKDLLSSLSSEDATTKDVQQRSLQEKDDFPATSNTVFSELTNHNGSLSQHVPYTAQGSLPVTRFENLMVVDHVMQ